ncbi:MAG: hypothetical protein EHM48_08585, partial [Planctomycetaceae bacterium]
MSGREKISEQLSAYLDGELSEADAIRVEQALAQDEQLARELAQLQAVRGMVRNLPRRKSPEDFVSNVLAMVERKHLVTSHVAERSEFSWGRYIATAAVVLLAVGIGGVIGVTLWKTPQISPHSESRLAAVTPVKDAWIDNLNYDDSSGSLVLADVKGDAVAVSNVDIYTDNIADTRKAIETSLFTQNLKPLTPEKARKDAVVINGSLNDNAFGNYYNSLRVNDEQVQILAYVNEKQMPAIENTLNTIRSRQNVSQLPDDLMLPESAHGNNLATNNELSPKASMGKTYVGKGGYIPAKTYSEDKGQTQSKSDQTADKELPSTNVVLDNGDKRAEELDRAKRELEEAKAKAAVRGAGAGGVALAKPDSPTPSPVVTATPPAAATQPAMAKVDEKAAIKDSDHRDEVQANAPISQAKPGSLPTTAPADAVQINGGYSDGKIAGDINASQKAEVTQQAITRQMQSQAGNNISNVNSQNRMQSQLANGRRLDLANNASQQNISGNNRAVLITINLRQPGQMNNTFEVQKNAGLVVPNSAPSTQSTAPA